jgi:hypothetical protein
MVCGVPLPAHEYFTKIKHDDETYTASDYQDHHRNVHPVITGKAIQAIAESGKPGIAERRNRMEQGVEIMSRDTQKLETRA